MKEPLSEAGLRANLEYFTALHKKAKRNLFRVSIKKGMAHFACRITSVGQSKLQTRDESKT